MPKKPSAPMRKCIKCQVHDASPVFMINKDMAYCEECAKILRLGESKESKMFQDFQEGVPDPRELTGLIREEDPEDGPAEDAL